MTKSTRVNYDAVAPNYDQRTEGGYLEGIGLALQDLAQQVQARRLFDLGCGTGRSLHGLAGSLRPNPICYGLDFSGGMLAQAKQFDSAYRLVNASAPLPPFVANSFDLVFCVHAFHHFPYKPQVVQNAYRMLKPGGAFAIVNFDPHQRPDWYVYDYFDGVLDTDLRRFVSVADKETMLRQVGFQHIQSPMVERITEEFIGEAVFDNYFLEKGSCSQLILLPDEAYRDGLARMRAAVAQAQARAEDVVFSTEIKNWMTHGFKPVSPHPLSV
jgi:ubiquinone/menaquinone biosynthesis C-methylase UbiE